MKQKLSVLALFVLLAVLPACSMKEAVRNMSLELKQVRVSDMTDNGFRATVYMQVNNPNRFGMKVAQLNYNILINGVEVGKGNIKDEIDIPSNGSAVAELPVEISYGGLKDKVYDIIKGRLDYQVTGEAVFKTWFGSYPVPFDTKKGRKLPAAGQEKPAEGQVGRP